MSDNVKLPANDAAGLLTKAAIFAADDIQTERVDVPEWDGAVLVRGLSGQERDRYEDSVLVRKGKRVRASLIDARAKLVVWSVVDENGKRLFSERDIKKLTVKSAAALSRIFDVASRLSGITDEDIEELEKNSDGVQSDANGSG